MSEWNRCWFERWQ